MSEQIHLAWYCIRGWTAGSRRPRPTSSAGSTDSGLPVIVVLTQVPMRRDLAAFAGQPTAYYHPDAVLLAEQIMAKRLPIAGGRPFMTYAKADEFSGQPAYGLRELLDATFRVAPDGVHGAPRRGAGN